jgi:hypothetical protein
MREGRVVAEISRAEATQEKIAAAMMGTQNGEASGVEQAETLVTEGSVS